MTLHLNEMLERQQDAKEAILAEYRAAILRTHAPEPGDDGRIRKALKELSLAPGDVAHDVADAAQFRQHQAAIDALADAQKRGDQLKVTELGEQLERAKAEYQPKLTAAQVAYDEANGAFETIRLAAQMAQGPLSQLRQHNPRLFPAHAG